MYVSMYVCMHVTLFMYATWRDMNSSLLSGSPAFDCSKHQPHLPHLFSLSSALITITGAFYTKLFAWMHPFCFFTSSVATHGQVKRHLTYIRIHHISHVEVQLVSFRTHCHLFVIFCPEKWKH